MKESYAINQEEWKAFGTPEWYVLLDWTNDIIGDICIYKTKSYLFGRTFKSLRNRSKVCIDISKIFIFISGIYFIALTLSGSRIIDVPIIQRVVYKY